MKKEIRGFVAGTIVSSLAFGGFAYASSYLKTIEVSYPGISVYKDNTLCQLKDSDGKAIEPFIYDGTTYMPVRGTAELADMQVTWDDQTKSVYLWENLREGETFLYDVCPPYETPLYYNTDWVTMAGKTYEHGFRMNDNKNFLLFNLGGNYSTMNFVIGHRDGTNLATATVQFYLDGKLAKEIVVDPEALPKSEEVKLDNALQMKITLQGDGITEIGLGNITVK